MKLGVPTDDISPYDKGPNLTLLGGVTVLNTNGSPGAWGVWPPVLPTV